MTDKVEDLSDEEIIVKKYARQEIDEGREPYFEKGGTIKKYLSTDADDYYHCDVFVPGEGSIQSDSEVKDTMVRKPRPEKKFGRKK